MNNERKIILFTFIAHFLFHAYELAFPALVIPLMGYLRSDLADIVKIGFPMYLLFGCTALPWGMAADRIGNRTCLILFLLGTGGGAIAASLSSTAFSLMVSLGIIGFFSGICHPAAMALISLAVKNRGTALGINGVAGSLGMVVAPVFAGVINLFYGWKPVYILIGIFALAWGLVLCFIRIDETPIERPASDAASHPARSPARAFVLLCIIVALGGLAYRINTVVLPALIEFKADFLWKALQGFTYFQGAGLSTMTATVLVSAAFVIGMFGQFSGGKLADSHELRKLYWVFSAVSLPFAVLMGSMGGEWLVVSAALYVFFALGTQPIENSLVAEFTTEQNRARGYGFTSILIFGVGSLAVYIVSWADRVFGISSAYYASAILIALMLAGIPFLPRAGEKASS